MCRFITILSFALACRLLVSAQALMPVPSAYESLLKGRVKQIDEFMARFNATETWDGQKITERNDTSYRKKYLFTLFDYSRFRDVNGVFDSMAVSFVNDVVGHDYQLRYEDSTWTAEVQCSVRVGGRLGKLKLYLHTLKVGKSEYRWVISNAYGDMFEVAATDVAGGVSISPVEHEVGFVGLLSMGGRRRNVSGLMDRRVYSPDRLSMLAVLLGNGLLDIVSVDCVRFHFHSVPGYSFTVEVVEKRGEYNTGWLITQLKKF